MRQLKAKKMQRFKQNDSDEDEIQAKTVTPSENNVKFSFNNSSQQNKLEINENYPREIPTVSLKLEEKEEIKDIQDKVNINPSAEIINVNKEFASPKRFTIDVAETSKKEEIFNKNSFFSKRG
jgi:hypothetical protein